MKWWAKQFSYKSEKFRKEFRREIRMFIIVTIGFTVAFTWRQTIFDVFSWLISSLTQTKNPGMLSILTSILITLISLGIIYITSNILREE